MKVAFLFLFLVSLIFSKDKIHINFTNLDLMQLIKITSQTINKNILMSENLNAKINFVSNEPISKKKILEILKQVLNENGFEIQEHKDFLKVVKIRAKKQLPIKKVSNTISIKEDTKVLKVIKLINLEAKNLQVVLEKMFSKKADKSLLKTLIMYENSSNSLILNGLQSEVLAIQELVKALDKRKKQIYVKAKIVELDNYLLNEVGFKFGILAAKSHGSGLHTFSTSLNKGTVFNFDTSSIGLQIPTLKSSLALGASLNLLNKTYALDIVSQPSLLCQNNKESSIYVGETVSIQTGSTITDAGSTKNVFEREDIGLTLKIKPRVDENKVLLNIETILEGIKNNRTNNNPDTSKKKIKTTAFVSNGESVVLGGLIEKRKEKIVHKVPYASDIPLVGELFKNKYKDNRTKNLIIIITPYIVPENKDLTYVTTQLSKIKLYEDKLLENFLLKHTKKNKKNQSEAKNSHETNFNKFFSNNP